MKTVTLILAMTVFTTEVFAQCDPEAALMEINQLGCLPGEGIEQLRTFFGSGTATDPRRLLETVSRGYKCLIEKSAAPEKYVCFRQVLSERVYPRFTDDELCLDDRLTRALVQLGQPTPDERTIDKSYNDFRLGLGVSRQIQANPTDFSSTYLSKAWCVNPVAPLPSPFFVQQLIDESVRLSGKHVGSLLQASLEDALIIYKGTEYAAVLQNDYDRLIKFDNGDLSGTSLYYQFERELLNLVPQPAAVMASDIPALLPRLEQLRERYLDKGAGLLQYKAKAWTPYERYSDLLFNLARPFQFLSANREVRTSLITASSRALWRGIELSTGAQAEGEAIAKVQEKLVDRIRTYGIELAFELRYPELVQFESGFVDATGKVLPDNLQCYIHAHLAQAHYVLGNSKEPYVHLEKSCGLLQAADLETLRKSLEPWTGSLFAIKTNP